MEYTLSSQGLEQSPRFFLVTLTCCSAWAICPVEGVLYWI